MAQLSYTEHYVVQMLSINKTVIKKPIHDDRLVMITLAINIYSIHIHFITAPWILIRHETAGQLLSAQWGLLLDF